MADGASFATGMAAGFCAGFGSGMGAGMVSAQKQARNEAEKNLRDAAVELELTVRDNEGHPVPLNEFIERVLPSANSKLETTGGKKVLLCLLFLGTACLVVLIAYFALMSN